MLGLEKLSERNNVKWTGAFRNKKDFLTRRRDRKDSKVQPLFLCY